MLNYQVSYYYEVKLLDFNNIDLIRGYGFEGFITVEKLIHDQEILPKVRGVYSVLYTSNNSPEFLDKGTGGFFKEKNPNVPMEYLLEKWVEDTKVIYIGKAGGETSSSTLYSRLKQYINFGQGKNVSHYGGRLIWQIKDSKNLVFSWKQLPTEDPRVVEKALINCFKKKYNKRPFANLVD